MKRIRLFVDMDGTIAKFYYHKECLEKMYEKGYFANLKPYPIYKTIKQIAKRSASVEVFILSACIESPYCEQEKIAWLNKYLPEIDKDHRIMVKVGENKADYIPSDDGQDCYNILLDDYGKNLAEWVKADSNNVAIKFLNGINNKSGKVYNHKIKNGKQLTDKLLEMFLYGKK